MSNFTTRLKEIRLKNNLTQTQAALELQITKSALSQYEAGKRIPKHDILIKISNLYNCSIDYLLGQSDTFSSNTSFKTYIEAAQPSFDYRSNEDIQISSSITEAKANILNTINKLPEKKQIDILCSIQHLLDALIDSQPPT